MEQPAIWSFYIAGGHEHFALCLFIHKSPGRKPFPAALKLAAEFVPAYIRCMVLRSFGRGRPPNAPATFIHPCQPIVAKQPPTGPGWAHELKHDGYRLQIHVRDGRVRLYTINGADWSKRYPLITEAARRIDGSAILDAEVVCWTQMVRPISMPCIAA